MDILDVWFDSGASHLAVLTKENDLPWPSSLYLEGGDQYRGWFHSSLLVGVGLRGRSPYRECATNGWTLDGEGRAMSKSLGNVIEPEKIIRQSGADVIRLWTSSVAFQEDVRLSDTILERLTEAYRKIRNTIRWALGNLHGFDPVADALPAGELLEIDQWILARTESLARDVRRGYDAFEFHRVYQAVYNFCTVELSAIYFDVSKDRLYTAATRSRERRSAQTALWRLTDALLKLFAPVLAFTCEEAWQHFAKAPGEPDSVHLTNFPAPEAITAGITDRARLADWDRLIEVRTEVLKALEAARNEKRIGAPLEAKVTLAAGEELHPLLEEHRNDLPGLFIVSQVNVACGEGPLAVTVDRADGVKCERCWKYTLDVGSEAALPTVCGNCAVAGKTMGIA
jgi:isoleucyl-tRNA synthetase